MFDIVIVTVLIILPVLYVSGLGFESLWYSPYSKTGTGSYCKTIEQSQKGWGIQIFLASMEQPVPLFVGPPIAAYILNTYSSLPLSWTIILALAYPIYLGIITVVLFTQSQYYGEHSEGKELVEVHKKEWLQFNDKGFERQWEGKKLPIETAIEAFQDGQIDFKQKGSKSDLTVLETMRRRYSIFTFNLTRDHIRSAYQDLLKRVWKHDSNADKADVSDVYNRGNDFYGWFLCDKMLYSVGLWDSSDDKQFENKETLAAAISIAQNKKLDKICGELTMMRPGMEHLDLGCGWGALALHATKNYKVKTTGITLSQEQANFIADKAKSQEKERKAAGVKEEDMKIVVLNAWEWLAQKKEEGMKYDVITCLEMSEHIGIRDYQKFCHAVRDILKDDGIFYLQIAGLRRNWQYEDLNWGLFMNRYVFPGADASCPLYWDVEQLERSGFEVRSVSNEGVHYGLTIRAWYHNWVWNKAQVVAKYGEKAWRNWSIFLSWSYLIAMQGSSTVYMISMVKNFPCDAQSRVAITKAGGVADFGIDRAKLWVDKVRTGWEKAKWEK